MKKTNGSKQAIIEAALYLFHLNGYHGTSIRDIAKKAKVNSATISYYFKNKNGLLEHCFISYLEEYTGILEKSIQDLADMDAKDCLNEILTNIFNFHSKNFVAARFIHREMSLDTNLNREILSTYLMKEKYLFTMVLEQGFEQQSFRKVSIQAFILQLKGLILAPVIHAHYAMEVLHMFPQEKYFMDKYLKQVQEFLANFLWSQPKVEKKTKEVLFTA
ncbi:forespore capture DNA-binding protein RefZ [Peribacillus acanthi]|uniref:forespore capture DNA-binding protein RefZ n=1 Tax=Peribacillus acanthi TaxID=2171554 RepID=UPI000D3E5D08|nr:forespore capture DNA-binding protein RefZ [Peribacillus acanthi]